MQNRKEKGIRISNRLMTIVSIIEFVISFCGCVLVVVSLGNSLNETVNYRIILSVIFGVSYMSLVCSIVPIVLIIFNDMDKSQKKHKEISKDIVPVPGNKFFLLQVGSIILLIVFIVIFLVC